MKEAFDKYMKEKKHAENSKMELSCAEAHEAGPFIIGTGEYKITTDGKPTDVGK